MNTNAKIGVAVAGGYLLGRTKKAKLALGLGMFLAGKKLHLDPSRLLGALREAPVLAGVSDQVRRELLDNARSAATSAVTGRVGGLADRLGERASALSPGSRDRDEPDEADEPDEPDESDDALERAEEEDEAEESRPSRKRTTRRPSASTASRSRTTANKATRKAPAKPASKTAGKTAARQRPRRRARQRARAPPPAGGPPAGEATMADSAFGKLRKDVLDDPAVDRLKRELRAYLQARATHAASALGRRLAQADGPGGMVKSLAQGGQALTEGKLPAQAALKVGTSHMMDKIKGFFGKKLKSGGGKSKSVTIIEDIDVGVPRREAYDQWSRFQEFSTFAKGVVSVEQTDDTASNWRVKVAKSTRSWKATVTEQLPDERIVWTTEGAKATVKGVVSFHAVTDDLTRVLLVLEYFPKGLFEKTGNIWRAQGRRARLDLKLYRKFVMTRDEPAEGWRGEIHDGEVVLTHEDAVEEEERAAEASEHEPQDEPHGDEEEPEEELEEDRYDDDPEPEEERYEDEEPEEDLDQEERESVGARR